MRSYVLLAAWTVLAGVGIPLIGMTRRPVDISKLVGLGVILLGIVIMEIGNLRKASH